MSSNPEEGRGEERSKPGRKRLGLLRRGTGHHIIVIGRNAGSWKKEKRGEIKLEKRNRPSIARMIRPEKLMEKRGY